MIRTVLGALFTLVATAVGSSAVVIGALLGCKDKVGSIFDITPRVWGKALGPALRGTPSSLRTSKAPKNSAV